MTEGSLAYLLIKSQYIVAQKRRVRSRMSICIQESYQHKVHIHTEKCAANGDLNAPMDDGVPQQEDRCLIHGWN